MLPRPSDEKMLERYIGYLGSPEFKPVLKKVAGRAWGHIIMATIFAMSGVGAPVAAYHGIKMLTHRRRWRKAMIAVAKAARPITTYPLIVNTSLTSRPGSVAPGLVIGSFRPSHKQDEGYWTELAIRLMFLRPEVATTPEEKDAIGWLNDETYVESRRLRLPTSLTGGFEVHAFHLKIVGDYFKSGLVDQIEIACVAVPGHVGAIHHIPSWIAAGEQPPLR